MLDCRQFKPYLFHLLMNFHSCILDLQHIPPKIDNVDFSYAHSWILDTWHLGYQVFSVSAFICSQSSWKHILCLFLNISFSVLFFTPTFFWSWSLIKASPGCCFYTKPWLHTITCFESDDDSFHLITSLKSQESQLYFFGTCCRPGMLERMLMYKWNVVAISYKTLSTRALQNDQAFKRETKATLLLGFISVYL